MIGGSPCTHWSIAQKNGREKTAEGIGWELFKNYLIAKDKFQPDFFLYENNKSAAQPIKDQISIELGVHLQYINSALVSAQNRQRFYAHNIPNVPQPEDRGILLRDILESSTNEKCYYMCEPVGDTKGKAFCLTSNYLGVYPEHTLRKSVRSMVAEPIRIPPYGSDDKSRPVSFSYAQQGCGQIDKNCFPENPNKQLYDMIAEPITEPIRIGTYPNNDGTLKGGQGNRVYSVDGKGICLSANGGGRGAKTGLYACPVKVEELVPFVENKLDKFVEKYGYIPENFNPYNLAEITDKTPTLTAQGASQTKSCTVMNIIKSDGKQQPIYEVSNGYITIKDKQYPIKLPDGFYIIRKLTVTECCRLQTMPDDYCRAVSNTQAYKGLGNGWTAEVIIHILKYMNIPLDEEIIILSMYDGIGTGRYCFDKMGYKNIKYFAYEIDKYAMQVAMSNYPDIIQCGDAFQVRNENWIDSIIKS